VVDSDTAEAFVAAQAEPLLSQMMQPLDHLGGVERFDQHEPDRGAGTQGHVPPAR
jgi:hypothetical protein